MFVDHSSINRWAIRFLPLLEKVLRKHKRPVGGSWRMDETCILVKGAWKYLYRAVDKEGRAVDFLLTARRDKASAMRLFDKAMRSACLAKLLVNGTLACVMKRQTSSL